MNAGRSEKASLSPLQLLGTGDGSAARGVRPGAAGTLASPGGDPGFLFALADLSGLRVSRMARVVRKLRAVHTAVLITLPIPTMTAVAAGVRTNRA
jgi:hypothetical protein